MLNETTTLIYLKSFSFSFLNCRSRQDDKWEHDLFDNDKPQITSMDNFILICNYELPLLLDANSSFLWVLIVC